MCSPQKFFLSEAYNFEGINTDEDKSRLMANAFHISDVRSFLELCSYNRRLTRDLLWKHAKPLRRLTVRKF